MARALNFRAESVEPILTGAQKLTVRPAGSGYRRGDLVKAVVRRRPAFAALRIEGVKAVDLAALTPRVAKQEGRGVEELQAALAKLYPERTEFEVISFSVA